MVKLLFCCFLNVRLLSAWVFEQQLSCEYLFSNLKNEHLVSIVIAIFPAVNVSVQWMTKEGGPGLYEPIGFDLVYNSAKFFSSSYQFCSSR
jgi:hypothetical protein